MSNAATTIRQNVSTSAASCNASNGNLPSSASTLTGGSSYYFNVQVSSDLYVKNAKLYIKTPGSSSYSLVHDETVGGYMRYTYRRYTVPNTSGTLYYYWKLTYTNGGMKTLNTSSVTVKGTSVTNSIIRQNVSTSAVSCNASNGNLPSSASTLTGGSSYYFNVQVSSDLYVKNAKLYIKTPGSSSSNPTLFEWFSSPIVYLDTEFSDEFKRLMLHYFSSKHSLFHYISMAESNYREYLRKDTVWAKKYFYVLRPVLACQWILDKGTPPPMLFSELKDAELPEILQPAVNRLLDIKMNAPELKYIPKVVEVNDYFDSTIPEIKNRITAIPDERERSWDELNQLFLQTLEKYPLS